GGEATVPKTSAGYSDKVTIYYTSSPRFSVNPGAGMLPVPGGIEGKRMPKVPVWCIVGMSENGERTVEGGIESEQRFFQPVQP
ncbi:hypothetical protein, partial [Aminivibrio sp.]|uniref:hypothetical protein n=1 Tax=Aminivibrio sp. TaxID=1872489 RepID=UPI0025B8B593